jgi:hypothetical protein
VRASLPRIMNHSLAVWLLLAGCGDDKVADYRSAKIAKTLEAVVGKPNPVHLNLTLPDRSKDATLTQVTGYYLRLLGEGNECPKGEMIEMVGGYDDQSRELRFDVNGKCSYAVLLKLGSYHAPTLALARSINYESDIKPIVEAHCLSCHDSYASYQELAANGELIVREVESKAMPKAVPLGDDDIAKFLAWKDGGYVEKSSDPLPTVKEQMMSEVYYQNNHNDYLMAYELLGRENYELRRSLWLQPAGEAAGLTLKELLTFGDN